MHILIARTEWRSRQTRTRSLPTCSLRGLRMLHRGRDSDLDRDDVDATADGRKRIRRKGTLVVDQPRLTKTTPRHGPIPQSESFVSAVPDHSHTHTWSEYSNDLVEDIASDLGNCRRSLGGPEEQTPHLRPRKQRSKASSQGSEGVCVRLTRNAVTEERRVCRGLLHYCLKLAAITKEKLDSDYRLSLSFPPVMQTCPF
jgi:hypothetical protein